MIDTSRLDDAIGGLRGWRWAGEQYANRGGRIEALDYQVDVALDEVSWRIDPDGAADDDVERPDATQITWAMDGMKAHFGDGCLGEDLQVVHEFLAQPSLFPIAAAIRETPSA